MMAPSARSRIRSPDEPLASSIFGDDRKRYISSCKETDEAYRRELDRYPPGRRPRHTPAACAGLRAGGMLMGRILGSLPVDCLLLGAVAVLTCFPYITGLGFYGADWGVLGVFGSLTDHFFGRLFSSHGHHYFALFRPGHMLYMALLYKVLVFSPLAIML